jgi:hypothetical protein
MSIFNAEAAKWLSSISKVIKKAFNGTRMFTWMGKAFEEVVKGIPSSKIKNVKLMKGIAVITMV